MKLLIFSGTTEGKRLCRALLKRGGFCITVSVATEYGAQSMEELSGCSVLKGRLDEEQMERLFCAEHFDAVVDATHPYAVEVTKNIALACKKTDTRYLRLLREAEPLTEHCLAVKDAKGAAQALAGTRGNILLTTGTKELREFCNVPEYRARMYPRVLPFVESIAACLELGFERSHIIAMQGPFCEELNLALIRQYSIRYLVTKESGKTGGFVEKISAAKRAGIEAIVIERPKERGCSFEEILSILKNRRGTHDD